MCRKVAFLLILLNEVLPRHTTSICGDKILYGSRDCTSGHMDVWIEYFTRPANECPQSVFQCYDKTGCFNSSDDCNGNVICNDHSDKTDCGKCELDFAPCNKNSEYCFDPVLQRCDGTLHCPKGEDELSCTELCPELLQCPNENKCITQDHLCDKNADCADEFDEKNCPTDETSSKAALITVIFIITSLCSIFFLCLIFHWISTRRNMGRLLENPPEFPLAPFHGPGEQEQESTSSELFSDADFIQGGEIYESYLQSIKNRKNRSARSLQTCITGKYSYMDLDGDNELIVLASLNVPREMCIGLTIPNEKEDLAMVVAKNESSSETEGNITEIYRSDNLDAIVSAKSSEQAQDAGKNLVSKTLHKIEETLQKFADVQNEETTKSSNSSEWTDSGDIRSSDSKIILVKSSTKIYSNTDNSISTT